MQSIIQLAKSALCIQYTAQKVVELLNKDHLNKLQRMMKLNPKLNVFGFLRSFRKLLNPSPQKDLFLTHAIFKLYQQVSSHWGTHEVTFSQISALLNDKMPIVDQEVRIQQKVYPTFFVPSTLQKQIFPPQILGKVQADKQRLAQRPFLSDKFNHLNRRVGHTQYSLKNNTFITTDCSSCEIHLLNSHLQLIKTLKTQLDLSKRDSFVTSLTWSEHEQRVACILNNFSISIWSLEDNFRYEVNVPLPLQHIAHPYTEIRYSETNKQWYTLDNRPAVYFLNSSDFLPKHIFNSNKVRKEKETEKVLAIELKYKRMLCLGFEKNLFLISFEKRQIIGSLHSFKTSITSICFSDSYQALFISNFQNSFCCYELSQYDDLSYKGMFQGHKHRICLLTTIEPQPIVCSLEQTAVLKLWDIRDLTCYQSISILKNILYEQMLSLPQTLCLVGSKIYLYKWYFDPPRLESIISVHALGRNTLLATNLAVKLYVQGTLKKVVKGVFPQDIYSVYPFANRILIANEDGCATVYDAKDFLCRYQMQLGVRPFYLHYEGQLLSVCSWHTFSIYFDQHQKLDLRRSITSEHQAYRYCKVAPAHDLILLLTHNDPNAYFYSFEKTKLISYIPVPNLVDCCFVKSKCMLFVLTTHQLRCMAYTKDQDTLTFSTGKVVELWQEHLPTNKDLFATKIILYSPIVQATKHRLIVSSSVASTFLTLSFEPQRLNPAEIAPFSQNYNAMRSATEYHSQPKNIPPSPIFDHFVHDAVFRTQHIQNNKDKLFVDLTLIGQYYAIADSQTVSLYSLHGEIEGIINIQNPLPALWNVINYSEDQLHQFLFIQQFIDNQHKYSNQHQQRDKSNVQLHSQYLTNKIITLQQIDTSPLKTFKSHSLREIKRVLDKQRQDKIKEERYKEQIKVIEQIKLKGANVKINQKYVNQSLAFLSVNRNNNLMKKGIIKQQMLSIKNFSRKLDFVINKDQKKSIVSKVSYASKNKINSKVQTLQQSEEAIKPLQKNTMIVQSEKLKDRLKRLEREIKQSKLLQRTRTKGSLPNLKRGI